MLKTWTDPTFQWATSINNLFYKKTSLWTPVVAVDSGYVVTLVFWHHSLILMNGFKKTEVVVFSCRLCFLRAFSLFSLMTQMVIFSCLYQTNQCGKNRTSLLRIVSHNFNLFSLLYFSFVRVIRFSFAFARSICHSHDNINLM